jgi:hypothetical protein
MLLVCFVFFERSLRLLATLPLVFFTACLLKLLLVLRLS